METGIVGLVILGISLGLRHGVDWDHIAAITDITSAATPVGASVADHDHSQTHRHTHSAATAWEEGRAGFVLASFYALGHATLVVTLGLFAIWASTLLPEWLDPIMERIVGLTLVVLGAWVFYALWRDGAAFRLRSRWMLVFALSRQAWVWVRSKFTGGPVAHSHQPVAYGARSAYTVGVIHGIGAETGSQALLLAGAAGATSPQLGTLLLISFTVGLLISNSAVAALSAFGFVSSRIKQWVYIGFGVLAGAFSLLVGFMFLTGQGGNLPDLREVINAILGTSGLN
jgi:high-affinity nickel permease